MMEHTVLILLQVGPAIERAPDVGLLPGVVGGAVGSFVTTFVVGAIMIALAPDYTVRMIETLRGETVDSFMYGLFFLLATGIMIVALVITVLGILLAIPLVIAGIIIWAIGSAIAFLSIGDRLIGRDDGWLQPLVVGAAINGGLALTGVGGLLSFCIGAAGFGAILHDAL